MKKKLMLAVSLLMLLMGANAQIRSYVGIVRQQYDEQFVTIMEEFRDSLRNSGYTTYAKYIDAYIKGGFGSGFIYVAPDGKNYVVTNRHVVPQASTVSIEFEDAESGEIKKYENLKVIAEDDDIDIVVCAFPQGEKPFKTGMKFSTSVLKDGDEVYTAGYPGLGGDPVWQFGKGIVTNSRARIKEMLDPEISTIIQHSAQVDSGNSGGPLLVADKSAPSGYAVAGINTWKAYYRDSTNYSIPVSVVSAFVDKAIKGASVETEDQLKGRVKAFADTFADSESDFKKIARYISYDLVAREGKDAFFAVLKYAPSNVRTIVANTFSNNPIEGLKYALVYQIFTSYRSRDVEAATYTVSEPVKSEKGYTLVLEDAENKKKYESEWALEHGLYRLVENKNLNDKSSKKSSGSDGKSDKKSGKKSGSSGNYEFMVDGLEIESPTVFDLRVGSSIPLKTGRISDFAASASLDVDMDIWCGNIWGFEFGVSVDFVDGAKLVLPYVGTGFKVPFNMDSLIISPFAMIKIGYGVATYDTTSVNSFGGWDFLVGGILDAGVQVQIDLDTCVPGISISYDIDLVGPEVTY
ncbi:MAG: serine protease, partial [Treponemataceae bacterium]|nr:serine protease [Treponemataceae bacterium]